MDLYTAVLFCSVTWAHLVFSLMSYILFWKCWIQLKNPIGYSHAIKKHIFLAATKQLYEWFSPSVRLSVHHTFLTMFPSPYHHEIFRTYYQWQRWRPCKKSRSEVKRQGHRGKKIVEFDPDWAFPDCNSSLNSPMATKWCTKLEVAWKRCPIVFQGHPSYCKVTQL